MNNNDFSTIRLFNIDPKLPYGVYPVPERILFLLLDRTLTL